MTAGSLVYSVSLYFCVFLLIAVYLCMYVFLGLFSSVSFSVCVCLSLSDLMFRQEKVTYFELPYEIPDQRNHRELKPTDKKDIGFYLNLIPPIFSA